MESSLNQKTWDFIATKVRWTDWSDVWLLAAEGTFLLVLFSSIAGYRWVLHRRRLREVGSQLTHWCETMLPTFQLSSPNQQLACIALLRDVTGHPVYVFHSLLGLRIALEEFNLPLKVLEALDEIAEERRRQTRLGGRTRPLALNSSAAKAPRDR
jgi:hypothetical protein